MRDAITAAGASVLDVALDPDHNRSVITFAGSPDAVGAAAIAAAGVAVRRIMLSAHEGVHPRIGAVDVIPFVPVSGISLTECAALAVRTAQTIWDRHRLPSYLYEAAARVPERRRLENIRRGGWERLREEAVQDVSRQPDIGGPELHPTAGATAVGARTFLIAFNVNLATGDLNTAKQIARAVRASAGGLPHVKALGLPLASKNQVQVSMNLTDFEATPLHVACDAVEREAARLGVNVAGTELIGLIPRRAAMEALAHGLRVPGLADAILEDRLAAAGTIRTEC